MKTLKWHQVHAWRLSQHGLSPRFARQDFIKAVTSTGGIQAQVMSAAELAFCTRVEGLRPDDVRTALWQDHTLVKTWAMRGTLHLLSTREFPLYVAARSASDEADIWSNYFAYYGFTPAHQEAFLAAVPQVLGKEPMTRQQLATAIAERTGLAHVREFLLSLSWGTPLKPLALRTTLEPMQSLEPAKTIPLLPLFDAYTIGIPRDHEPVLSKVHKSRVFRPQGWINAVILINGSMQGVWQYRSRRSQTLIKVSLFCPSTAGIRKGIEAEMERLRDFFKTNVILEYEEV